MEMPQLKKLGFVLAVMLTLVPLGATSAQVATYQRFKQTAFTVPPAEIAKVRKLSDEFFESIRDGSFRRSYSKLSSDYRARQTYGQFLTSARAFQRLLVRAKIDERFSFVSSRQPVTIKSCVVALTLDLSKYYLTAHVVRNAESEWKVEQYALTSSPSTGCPQ